MLTLLKDAGICKDKENTFCKEKLSSILNNYEMNHLICRTKARCASAYYYTIQLTSCIFQSSKRRRYSNSVISFTHNKWNFEA